MQAAIPQCSERPNRNRANYVNTPRQFMAATRTVSRQIGHLESLVQPFAVSTKPLARRTLRVTGSPTGDEH